MSDQLPNVVRIPGGEFVMGSDEGADDERPAHRVFVDEYLLGITPITNDQYAHFVRETDHRPPTVRELPQIVTAEREAEFRALASPYAWRAGLPPSGRGRHPVTLVTHDDALAYCKWLSGRLGVAVRLPSEAEWERAARGGIDGRRFPSGDDLQPEHANYLSPGRDRHRHGTTPVGSFPMNPFGLADLAGNVWEWVDDWYDPQYYGLSPRRNPRGPAGGSLRIVRGGSWISEDPRMLGCAHRHTLPPDSYAYSIGFRIAYSARP